MSGFKCLIHLSTHHCKSCDKGLEAVTKQPQGATMMAMTYQDQVLNQHHPTLSDLTAPVTCQCPTQGGGRVEACMGHMSVPMMLLASEELRGGFLRQFLMGCGEYGVLSQPEVLRGSVVGFDFKTPFSRLKGQNPCFWLQVPNSLVNSP